MDGTAVLHSGACCPAALRHVPAAAAAGRGPEAGEHVVRRGSRRDAREERPVHGGTLEGRRHLRARHRRADGLSPDVQERTYLCGLVHDIGKIGLPASLLLKDGPLTLEERRQMQEHPAIGEAILKKVDLYADVARRRPPPPRAGRRRGLPGRTRGRRHSARFEDHRRRRRVQRDDVKPRLPRRDAEPGCATPARAGRRKSVRYDGCRRFRSDPGRSD